MSELKNPDAINYRSVSYSDPVPEGCPDHDQKIGILTLTFGDKKFYWIQIQGQSYNEALKEAIEISNMSLDDDDEKLYRFEYEFKVDGKEETRTESIFSVYEDGRDQADYLCKHFNLIRFERSDIDDDGWGS